MRPLAVAALAAAALHLVAGVATLLFLAPGLPPAGDAGARAAYVDANATAWRAGWALWTLSAAALLVVLALLAPENALGRLALVFAAAAFAADTLSQSILTLALPGSAAPSRALLEDAAWTGAAVVANGQYTVALALAVVGASRARTIRVRTAQASIPIWLAGAAMSVAAAAEWPRAQELAGGALTFLLVFWLALVGVEAWRGS